MVHQLVMIVAVVRAETTLKWTLVDNVLNIVQNQSLTVLVTKRSVIMVMRHQMFTKLTRQHACLTARTRDQSSIRWIICLFLLRIMTVRN